MRAELRHRQAVKLGPSPERLALLEELGFPPAMLWVLGRSSVADLFKPEHRCGIYVLGFSNGDFYAGQALDVVRRFSQHCVIHSDIAGLAFKRLPASQLHSAEREVIARLEMAGWPLRNIALVSSPLGASDFDWVMSPEQQDHWLADLAFVDDDGPRFVNEELRRRYHGRLDRLLRRHYAPKVVSFLRQYVRAGLPAFRRGEVAFWACSCLPAGHVISRINVFWQEVLTVFIRDGQPWLSFHVARSPIERPLADRSGSQWDRFRSLEREEHTYVPGGPDQVNLLVRLEEGPALLAEPAATSAARLFNLRLMRKGPCNFGRCHCLDLADRLIETPTV